METVLAQTRNEERMDTDSHHPPSSREARETLQQLAEDERAVRYPPIPRWFFVAMAAAVAGLHLAQLLPPPDSSEVIIGVGVVSLLLASRYWLNRAGVAWASVAFTDLVPFLAVVLGSFGLCWVIAATTGAWWIWIVGGVVAGGVVVRTGHTYRQEFGDGV